MDNRLQELNTLFVDTFDAIMRVEEKSLKHVGGGKLSISEFHTLECIGGGEDARVTFVELTREGRKMNRLHRYFHEQMLGAIGEEFSEEEMDYLLRCIRKLNAFFEEKSE